MIEKVRGAVLTMFLRSNETTPSIAPTTRAEDNEFEDGPFQQGERLDAPWAEITPTTAQPVCQVTFICQFVAL
jgi:hypothetical protein